MAGGLEEVGRSGLLYSGGIISEEFLTQLRGPQGRRVFREMSDNDPVIGGILFAFEKTLSKLDWHIEVPDNASPDDKAIADFVQECFEDMSEDWGSTLSSILSMMTFGWAYHEIVYKVRGGRDATDSAHMSKFTDGKIGWRKWAGRSQESLLRWEIDDNGGLNAMTQMVWGVGPLTIPIEKALLFRTTMNRSNPEGRPLIRNAYRPWFYKKRIEEIEAIGIERDLAGLPVAWVDPLYFSPNASDDERALFNQVNKIVTEIKRNQMEGVVFPLMHDEHGHKTIDLSLMSTGGSRQFDTDKIIGRYSQQIAMSVLADFLMLGHENVGSQSLGGSKIELWMMAVESLAKSIAAVVNQYAIPRLLKLNGMDCENPPELVFGSIENVDLGVLGLFVKSMVDAGVIVPDMKLEEMLRDLAKLTPIDEETRDEMGAGEIPMSSEMVAAMMAPDKPPVKPIVAPIVEPGTNPQTKVEQPIKKVPVAGGK